MKKMFTKSLAVLLAAFMLLTAAPLSGFVGLEWPDIDLPSFAFPEINLPDFDFNFSADAATIVKSGSCGTNVTYTLDSDGVLTISGTGAMEDYDNWDIYSPWHSNRAAIKTVIIENGVTSIGYRAFYGCTKLSSVTIPDSVTSIGNYAFYYCKSLTSVTIPDSVTSIGDDAFWYCTLLTSVHIFDIAAWCNIDFDGSYANPLYYAHNLYINGTLVTTLTIPDSVTSIGDYAFSWCTKLTSVTIPDSVTSIGDAAFGGCESLASVTIPDSVTSIGEGVFSDCHSLTSVTIPDSVTSIGNSTFHYCDSLISVTIPDSVTSIGEYAFYYCKSLTSFTIPDSVTSIGRSAFEYCTKLTSVTIGDSVTSIREYAFQKCTSLTDITVDADNTTYCSEDGVLFNKSKTELIQYPVGNARTSYTIPDSVTSIGDWAFYDCTSLTSVTIGDSVSSIGGSAFRDCTSLTSVTIPDSVTSIGEYAFYYCTKLTSVTIPDSVTSIGECAFYYCTKLTSVTIPDSVTSIGNSAFYYCKSLTSVTIPDSVTSIGDYAFYDCTSLKDVYYSGTEEQWAKISIDSGNTPLTNATIHFSGNTGTASTNKKNKSFTITTKQNGYNEKFFELTDVQADIDGTIINPNGSKIEIKKSDLNSADIVLEKSGFRDYIIPFRVAKSFSNGDNFDAYMTLDKKDGKPYISSVFARNTSETRYQDLFKNPMVAEIDNTYDIVVSGVGLSSDAVYYIAQDSTHKIKSTTGVFSAKDLYSELTLNKAVKVYAVDNGVYTDFETLALSKSSDDGSLAKMLNTSTYSLGGTGGITIKIPDKNPIFGNSEISLNAFSAPLTVYYDTTNDTYIGTIGWDLYSYTKEDKTVSNASGSLTKFGEGETKNAFQNFKESFSYFNKKPFAEDEKDRNGKSYKEQWNSFVNRCKTASKYSQKSYDKNFSVDFLGYIEFAVTEQGFTVKEASLKIGTEFSYSYTYQGAVWVIPAYFKATLGASASLEGSGKRAMVDKGLPFEYEITLDVEPKLALEAGIGVEKLAKAGVEAKGTAPLKVEFFNQHITLKFHGEINIKTKAFIFTWDKKLCEGEMDILDKYWGKTKTYALRYGSSIPQYASVPDENVAAELIEYYNESTSIADRNYAQNTSGWLSSAKMSRISADSEVTVKQLQTSVLEDGKPVAVTVGDKVLMAWIEDCADRDSYNRMRLMYSVYDGVSWSAPLAVYDDGKNDDAPVLATDGTNVYFAWQKINAVLDENSVVTDVLQQVDICIATYDSVSGTIRDAGIVCSDNGYDYAQAITVENNKPVVYFASCADPSVAVSYNSKINKYADNTVETLVSSLSFVQAISADGSDMSFVIDTDGDLATSEDINAFTYSDGNGTEYDKQGLSTAIVGSYYGFIDGEKVMFVTDGTNIYYDANGERQSVFDFSRSLSSLNLIDRGGNPAFLWTEETETGNQICYTFYDGTEWSSPVTVTTVEGYYFDAVSMVAYKENLVGVFMQDELSYDAGNESYAISQVNLAYITINDYSDIKVGSVFVEEATLIPENTAEICVYVENLGTETINNTRFTLSDSLSAVQTAELDIALAPGESKNVYISYYVPQNFTQTELTVTAEIMGKDDADTSDNSISEVIGRPDIRITKTEYAIDGDYYVVTAFINNNSVTTASELTANLYLNEEDGSLHQEAKMENLSGDECGYVQFYIEKEFLIFDDANTAKLYLYAESEGSKYGRTATECILITNPEFACEHPQTETVSGTDATCTQTGLTEGKKCSVCGEILVAQTETPVVDHTDTDGDGLCDHCSEQLAPLFVIGDVDGNEKIEAADARLALRAAVKLETLTEAQTQAADADKDGEITSSDARLILRAAVGLGTL